SRIERYDLTITDLVLEVQRKFAPADTLLIVPAGAELPEEEDIRPLYGQGKYYLPSFEQRVLYVYGSKMRLFKRLRWPSEVSVARVMGDEFTVLPTNVVTVPARVRWLVWLGEPERQPYQFDRWWTRYRVGVGAEIAVADLRKNVDEDRWWGPFEF